MQILNVVLIANEILKEKKLSEKEEIVLKGEFEKANDHVG